LVRDGSLEEDLKAALVLGWKESAKRRVISDGAPEKRGVRAWVQTYDLGWCDECTGPSGLWDGAACVSDLAAQFQP
jgi:hypothetical protein